MKKAIAIILVVCTALLTLTACGGSGSSAAPASSAVVSTASTDASASAPTPAGAKKKFIIAHSMAVDTCFGALTDAFQESLTASGLFDVEVYPAAQLGSDTECIQNMQLGTISLYPTYSGTYSSFAQPCYVFDRMFSFTSKEAARNTYQDEEFLAIFDKEMQKYGVKVLGLGDMGFRKATSNKYIDSVAGFNGLIIRTVENPILMAAWRAVGANPTPVQFTELYSALQQGVCEAQENPIEVTYSSKLYEQQKYLIDTDHTVHAIIYGLSLEYWNSLNDAEKQAVEEAAQKSIKAERQFTDDATDRYMKVFEDTGMQHIEITDSVRKEIQTLMTDSWKMVEEKVSPELYSAYVSAIERGEAAAAK